MSNSEDPKQTMEGVSIEMETKEEGAQEDTKLVNVSVDENKEEGKESVENKPNTDEEENDKEASATEKKKAVKEYKYPWMGKLDSMFSLTERGGSYTGEIIGGITTFLACCYILAVNPQNLVNPFSDPAYQIGPLWYSTYIGTSIGSFVGTLIMGLLPNLPFAQAPGMGLNFQVGSLYATGYEFGAAMTVVFLAACVFLLISAFHLRDFVFDGIPNCIREAISVGIGLFVAFIGMKNAGLIIANPGTFISMADFNELFATGTTSDIRKALGGAFVCLASLVVIGIFDRYHFSSSVLIGILFGTVLGIPLGVTPYKNITSGWNVGESFRDFFSFKDGEGAFGMCFLGFPDAFSGEHVAKTISNLISFCLVDLFDTLGTLHGCAVGAGLLDETGKVINFGRCMWADSLGTLTGSICGTSSVTTFVESGAGISAGARTGLASVITAILFFLSIFIAPVFSIVPGAATGAALIYVGCLMMKTVKGIDFSNHVTLIPIFMTIALMPLTYSITNGIGMGILLYSAISIICWIVDLITWKAMGKIIPEADIDEGEGEAQSSEATTTVDGTSENESNTQSTLDSAPPRPKFPLTIVTCLICVFFLVMFLLPDHW